MKIIKYLVTMLWLTATAANAAPGVTVDAHTGLVLGGEAEISSRLFGITAFEGFPGVISDRDYRARVEALRPGCIRFSGNLAWFAPAQYDPEWYKSDEAARQFQQTLLYGSRYPIGRFLPVVRQMGAEPMCSLGAPPAYLIEKGTNNPSDFDRWAEYCAGYVGLWKRFDPKLRLVQVWNEPNSDWFRDPRANDKGTAAADLHIAMANKVARAIKARYPDVQVGGPVLCWPPSWPPEQKGMRPWYTWEGWTLPWLRGTKGNLDFFDFHVYDVSPEDLAVQVEMLENEAQLAQGKRLPIWITESNTNLKPEELKDRLALWNHRILPYERLLLHGILPQADKIEGNLYHDLHAKGFTLLPGTADQPDPTYWLLWVLRDLRGQRLVTTTADPALTTVATLEEDCVTLLLFNDSDAAKEVPVSLSLPGGYWTGPTVHAIGVGGDGACQRLDVKAEFTHVGGNAQGSVSLPAHATASLLFRLDHFPTLKQRQVREEVFGDRTMQYLQTGKAAVVNLALPQASLKGPCRLRLGLLGSEGTEQFTARFNGKELPLKAAAFQEIPLDAVLLQKENKLEVRLAQPVQNPKLALGFAALITERSEH